jgi:hypothetical protein
MPPAGFETAFPAGEQPLTYPLDTPIYCLQHSFVASYKGLTVQGVS